MEKFNMEKHFDEYQIFVACKKLSIEEEVDPNKQLENLEELRKNSYKLREL